MSVDHILNDQSQLLHRIAVKHQIPAYVKQAAVADLESPEGVKTCVQISPEPRFPTHSKAATWLSYASFNELSHRMDHEEVEKIQGRFEKRAAFWGIQEDLDAIRDAEAALTKVAAASDEKYPVRNEKEALAAFRFLRDQYNADERSTTVTERCDLATKLASYFAGDPEFPAAATAQRGCLDGKRVAKQLRDSGCDHEAVEKVAQLCEAFSPQEMQETHRMVAEICEKLAIFDGPAELELAKDSTEDMLFLSNGTAIEKQAIATADVRLLDSIADRAKVVGTKSYRRVKAAASLLSDQADELARDFADWQVKTGNRVMYRDGIDDEYSIMRSVMDINVEPRDTVSVEAS